MELKKSTAEKLKTIVEKDYGVLLTDEQANELGVILLRLTRVGVTALARAEDKKLSVQAREENSLEPKTSM